MKNKEQILRDLVKEDIKKILGNLKNGEYNAAASQIFNSQQEPAEKSRKMRLKTRSGRLLLLFGTEAAVCIVALLYVRFGSPHMAKIAFGISFAQGTAYLVFSSCVLLEKDITIQSFCGAIANIFLYSLFRTVMLWQLLFPEISYINSITTPIGGEIYVRLDAAISYICIVILLFIWGVTALSMMFSILKKTAQNFCACSDD